MSYFAKDDFFNAPPDSDDGGEEKIPLSQFLQEIQQDLKQNDIRKAINDD